MNQFIYKKVHAFSDGRSNGNPAAFLFTGETQLSPQRMLEIAKEHKGFVSEVVFVSQSGKANMKLTYYSSECEVDFCGHGTIATMYELIRTHPDLVQEEKLLVETHKKGLITVYNKLIDEDSVYICAPEPTYFSHAIPTASIAEQLGLQTDSISSEHPIEIIDAGLKTLIVPISTLGTAIRIWPDENTLQEFCLKNEIDIILVFSLETEASSCFAHTRVFAPKFGYLEDPATGSGNSAFGNYLLKNRLWDGQAITIEQGPKNSIFNHVKLRFEKNDLLFGGKARLIIEGTYHA